jgi:hypothetical protein
MQIGAAHSSAADAHQRGAWRGDRRRPLDERQLARARTEKGSQSGLDSGSRELGLTC